MRLVALAFLGLSACAAVPQASRPLAPFADYHQHLVSADFAPLAKVPVRDAAALLTELDAAGIPKAVVLSVGYTYGDERKALPNPDQLTRQENDWTSGQVGLGRGRLVGFCSANPLRDAALAELERCLGLPGMVGIKIHVGNAGMSFRNPNHVQRLANIFALGQNRKAPILIHMRPRGGDDYGAPDVPVFLEQIAARAPSVPIIVAHLGASSPGYPRQNDEVMWAFAVEAARKKPIMRNIYFDVSANIWDKTTPEQGAAAASRMRTIGLGHFLYGSDLTAAGGSVAAAWSLFQNKMPLTSAEFRRLANNRLPFMR